VGLLRGKAFELASRLLLLSLVGTEGVIVGSTFYEWLAGWRGGYLLSFCIIMTSNPAQASATAVTGSSFSKSDRKVVGMCVAKIVARGSVVGYSYWSLLCRFLHGPPEFSGSKPCLRNGFKQSSLSWNVNIVREISSTVPTMLVSRQKIHYVPVSSQRNNPRCHLSSLNHNIVI
jgi:hypothetical protein